MARRKESTVDIVLNTFPINEYYFWFSVLFHQCLFSTDDNATTTEGSLTKFCFLQLQVVLYAFQVDITTSCFHPAYYTRPLFSKKHLASSVCKL